MQNCATLNIFKKRCFLQVQAAPKLATKTKVQLAQYSIGIQVEAQRLLLEMR